MNIGGCALREFPSPPAERLLTYLMVTSILDRMGMGTAMAMEMATGMEETGTSLTHVQL